MGKFDNDYGHIKFAKEALNGVFIDNYRGAIQLILVNNNSQR